MKHYEHDSNYTCPDCQIGPFVRNNYFTGKLMTARDFFTEQDHFSSKLRHHHQRLHGSGVVCGLEVVQHTTPDCRDRYVVVKPGTAIDCCGREILVVEEEALDLTRFETVQALFTNPDDLDHRLQVCIRYRECPTEEVPVLYDDCGCDETQCAPNRILESYAFDILVDQPLPQTEVNAPQLKRHSTTNPPHATRVALYAAQSSSGRLYALAADSANNKTVFQLETQFYSVVGTHALPAKGLELAVSQDGSRLYVVIENTSGQAGDPRQLVVVDTANMGGAPVRAVDVPNSAGSPVYLTATPSAAGALFALVGTTGDLHLWSTSLNDPGPDPVPETKNIGGNLSGLALSSNGQFGYTADATNNRLVSYDIATKAAGEIKVTPNGANPSFVTTVASSGPDLLAVTSPADKALYLVEPETPSLLGSVTLTYNPLAVTVSPGGAWAYVLEDNGTQSFVEIVNLTRLRQMLPPLSSSPFAIGPNSRQIIVSPSGQRLYVPYEDDLTVLGRGGVAVLEVDEQRCQDLLYGPCPECGSGDCLILATIENYRAGFSVIDIGDPPIDPAIDRTNQMARIDNRLGRKLLPSVQALAKTMECLLERETGGTGTQGPPGPPGPAGNRGPGIDNVAINWVPCGQEPQPPQIVQNPDGTRTLVMEIPDGCQDLVVVNQTAKCGESGSAKIESVNGVRTLTVSFPPPLTDLVVDINQIRCEEAASGSVQADNQGQCHLVLNIPTGCKEDIPFPHVVAINWPHDGLIAQQDVGRTLAEHGLVVAFDKLMIGNTLNHNTFQVLVRRNQEDGSYCFCNLRGTVEPGRAYDAAGNLVQKCGDLIHRFEPAGPNPAVNGARFKALNAVFWQSAHWGDPDENKGKQFRVILEGDFILGQDPVLLPDGHKVHPAADGNHLGPGIPQRCPSGNGTEGGTFLSWFSIVPSGPGGPIIRTNLNTASREELVALPGVDGEVADAIISRRTVQPFTGPSELLKISGIGKKKLEKLLPLITVE